MSDKTTGELIKDPLRLSKIKVTWILAEFADRSISPEFSDGQQNTWNLEVVESNGGNSIERLDLNLVKCASPVTCYCTVSFLGIDRKEVRKQKEQFVEDLSSGRYLKFDTSIADSQGDNELKVEGRWTIICRLAVVEAHDPSNNLNDTGGLSRELNKLFTSERFSDVILCAGGREFKAHRSILAARSPVFNSIFSSELEESKSGRVELTDVSAEVLEEMLKFMYTGKSVLVDQMCYHKENKGINQGLAIGLLKVADKYQLDGLRAICEDALAVSLTAESAHKILALSCLHRTEGLAYRCVDFISSNKNEFIKQLMADGSFLEKTMA